MVKLVFIQIKILMKMPIKRSQKLMALKGLFMQNSVCTQLSHPAEVLANYIYAPSIQLPCGVSYVHALMLELMVTLQ